MEAGRGIVRFSVDHKGLVTWVMVGATLGLALAAALPTLRPRAFPMLHPVRVDTDPENMLPADEPVRVFHNRMKAALGLHDMVVVGVVNEEHPEGVFNVASLGKVYDLTAFARTLRWADPADPARTVGVIEPDLMAPSTVDNIEQAGPGSIRFEWLLARPPATEAEALAVRDKARRIPFFQGTLLSEDGKALCLYLPLTSKDLSYRVYAALREKTAALGGPERFYITGLPVAEDTFGVEMFKQMAISAPLAMAVIFLLMLFFFRKLLLIVAPMVVALVSVIATMGLLVVTGKTIHIMSSMIPIFIMPIAVLDAVHILSEFFDRYQEARERRAAVLAVMDTLFVPMLYTSLTTAAGFASLALTPIPPVQVFGLYVAFGVVAAWVATVTFIPAYIMFIPQKRLENFGLKKGGEEALARTPMARLLRAVGRSTYRWARPILLVAGLAAALAAYGISRIRVNDNPTRWFTASHPIRVADRVLNAHFGGTYMAYLALEAAEPGLDAFASDEFLTGLLARLHEKSKLLAADYPKAAVAFDRLIAEADRLAGGAAALTMISREENEKRRAARESRTKVLDALEAVAARERDSTKDNALRDAWDQAGLFLSQERQRFEVFKDPEVLRYVEGLQKHLLTTGVVGKSNSLADIVRTVYRELMEGSAEYFRIPDTPAAVAQCLVQYESSHRPQDVGHFVTPDYRATSLWVQLRGGDNRDMQAVVRSADTHLAAHPPPRPLEARWFGLTYINVIWQQKMVVGMLEAFLGSFLVVLLMMIVLFRSALWGILSMVPLTVTVGMIYGMVGLLGKDYDMPVAVLSSLTLGLAVDYAIHFLSRAREARREALSWQAAVPRIFGEPARAITRNVVVIGLGFLPLLAAPLVPYQTVGIFMAAILLLAGVVSLLVLPALVRVLEPLLFPAAGPVALACQCGTCLVSAVAAVLLVAVNVHQFLAVGWTLLTWISLPALAVLAGLCALLSRREACRAPASAPPEPTKGDST
jgi:hypothetical protein